MKKSKVFRPPGIVVFVVFLAAAAVVWWLFADRVVQRTVESTGETVVGAKVELESVDLRPTDGSIRLTGLQVANPDAPMTNLMEAEEILVDLMLEPLLQRKVVVQNLVVTGVRFNTPRETSGALENADPEAGALWRNVNGWADQVELPSLSLETLTGAVRTEAISPDSLRTVAYARQAVARVDSMRADWESKLTALDPAPRIDSAQTILRRLEGFRPSLSNATQLPGLLRDGRDAVSSVTSLQTDVSALDDAVRSGIGSVGMGPDVVADLRAQDLAYARRLLDIPSLDAPTISPALFGGTALTWLKPVLFWARTAEKYLPPGLNPRNRPGPRRARAEGTTVEFPGRATYPAFLLQQGELGMELTGSGPVAGTYTALLTNLTSSPSLLGQPMEMTLGRRGGTQAPGGLTLSARLDHTTDVLRDSVAVAMLGVALPEIDLGEFGGRLNLGLGDSDFSLSRIGDRMAARLDWSSTELDWTRTGTNANAPSGTLEVGSVEWAQNLVWNTLTGIDRLELGMALEGTLDDPSITVTSNIGQALAASLQRELGQQIADAEARLRQEVDSRIQPLVQDARGRVEAVRTEVVDVVGARRQEVDDLRARLDARVRELTGG